MDAIGLWLYFNLNKGVDIKNWQSKAWTGCQNMTFEVPPASFFHVQNQLKLLAVGVRPGPRWESSRRSSRPPSRLGRGQAPSPDLTPLGAFGSSIFAPSVLNLGGYIRFDSTQKCPPIVYITPSSATGVLPRLDKILATGMGEQRDRQTF